jgi:hypothetical protein
MDKLQTYEFVGLISPGAFTIYGLSRIYPQPGIGMLAGDDKISFGEFGLLLVLAFVAGHLVQSLGNAIENLYWWFWSGKPTDWPRSGARYLISPQQTAKLPSMIRELLKMECPEDVRALSRKDWRSFTRQMYAEVKKSGQGGRIDIFTGAYDLLRGIAASIVVLAAAALLKWQGNPPIGLSLYVLFLLLFCLAVARMHRFGVHYASELFVEFLTIDSDAKHKPELAD